MFPMTLTIHNQTQLAAIMAALSTPEAPFPTVSTTAVTAEEKEAVAQVGKQTKASAKTETPADTKPTATAKKADVQDKPTTEESSTTQHATASGAAPADEELTYEAVGQAITEAVKADRAHVVATLKKYGATKGPELKRADWAAFLRDLKGA